MLQVIESILSRIRKLEAMEPGPSVYILSSDPGAVGAGSIWINTGFRNALYLRNSNNTTWEEIGNTSLVEGRFDISVARAHPAAGDTSTYLYIFNTGAANQLWFHDGVSGANSQAS